MRLERREYLATYTVPRSIRVHSVSLVGRRTLGSVACHRTRRPTAYSDARGLRGCCQRYACWDSPLKPRGEGRFPDVPKEECRFGLLSEASVRTQRCDQDSFLSQDVLVFVDMRDCCRVTEHSVFRTFATETQSPSFFLMFESSVGDMDSAIAG
jgi:hypothetical protein